MDLNIYKVPLFPNFPWTWCPGLRCNPAFQTFCWTLSKPLQLNWGTRVGALWLIFFNFFFIVYSICLFFLSFPKAFFLRGAPWAGGPGHLPPMPPCKFGPVYNFSVSTEKISVESQICRASLFCPKSRFCHCHKNSLTFSILACHFKERIGPFEIRICLISM